MSAKPLILNKQQSNKKDIFVILAGGYGKRIRSTFPKVLLRLWGKSSLERIVNVAEKGLKTSNQVIIVGYKAEKVIADLGEKKDRIFALQKKQLGTGHAIKIALEHIPKTSEKRNLFTFPGDAGLIDSQTLSDFKRKFKQSRSDMMMLTGYYSGDSKKNYYGRIIRIAENAQVEKKYRGQVLAIVQMQDIQAMKDDETMVFKYVEHSFNFSKEELMNIREFDSGMMAFALSHLRTHISAIKSDNVQNEIYLTDLVSIFNKKKLSVKSHPIKEINHLLGFNDKETLKKMENVLRDSFYNNLKNIIDIKDERRFFIDEDIIEKLILLDKTQAPLNISIGMNASIGKGVKLTKNVIIGDNTTLSGNIILEENVVIGNNVNLITRDGENMIIRKNCQILGDNELSGEIEIAKNSIIDKKVTLKGNSKKITKIGENCKILGYSYLENTCVGNNNVLEHCILIAETVESKPKNNSKPLRFLQSQSQ